MIYVMSFLFVYKYNLTIIYPYLGHSGEISVRSQLIQSLPQICIPQEVTPYVNKYHFFLIFVDKFLHFCETSMIHTLLSFPASYWYILLGKLIYMLMKEHTTWYESVCEHRIKKSLISQDEIKRIWGGGVILAY